MVTTAARVTITNRVSAVRRSSRNKNHSATNGNSARITGRARIASPKVTPPSTAIRRYFTAGVGGARPRGRPHNHHGEAEHRGLNNRGSASAKVLRKKEGSIRQQSAA